MSPSHRTKHQLLPPTIALHLLHIVLDGVTWGLVVHNDVHGGVVLACVCGDNIGGGWVEVRVVVMNV